MSQQPCHAESPRGLQRLPTSAGNREAAAERGTLLRENRLPALAGRGRSQQSAEQAGHSRERYRPHHGDGRNGNHAVPAILVGFGEVRDGNNYRADNCDDLQSYYGAYPRSLGRATTPGAKLQRYNIFPVECSGSCRIPKRQLVPQCVDTLDVAQPLRLYLLELYPNTTADFQLRKTAPLCFARGTS